MEGISGGTEEVLENMGELVQSLRSFNELFEKI